MRAQMSLAAAALFAAGTLPDWLTTSGQLTTDVQAQDKPAAGARKSPSGFLAPGDFEEVK